MDIGTELKKQRHLRFISKLKMSEDIGIPCATITNIEEGRTSPRLSNVLKMCSYLGLTLVLEKNNKEEEEENEEI